MYKKLTLKRWFLMVLLAVPLILSITSIITSIGYAGGPLSPAPANFELINSKAVDGLLNAVVDENDDVVQYIIVTCKAGQGILGPLNNSYSRSSQNLADTEADCSESDYCLEGQIFEDVLSYDPNDPPPYIACFPDAVPLQYDDLIITRAKNFINVDTAISAEVTLRLGQFVSEGF
jgi:hypothetical protein